MLGFDSLPNELLLKVLNQLPLENLCEIYKLVPALQSLISNLLFENIVIIIKGSDKWNPFRIRINGFTFSYDFSNSRNSCLVFLNDLHNLKSIDQRYVKSVTVKCNDYLTSHLLSTDHIEQYCLNTLHGTDALDQIGDFVSGVPNLCAFENYCPYIQLPVNKIKSRCFKIHTRSIMQMPVNESTVEELQLKFYKPQRASLLLDDTDEVDAAPARNLSFEKLRSLTIEHQLEKLDGSDFINLLSLETLSLKNNRIRQFRNLSADYFPNLVELDLSNNYLSAIDDPINLPTLKKLHLNDNYLFKIKNLCKLGELEYLDLGNNKLEAVENLSLLKSLKTLKLSGNQILQVENLRKLTKLSDLNVSSNNIYTMKGLNAQISTKSLVSLNLRNNKIEKIDGLDAFLVLRKLNLSNNHIQQISNLDSLINLEHLNLEFNNLNSLNSLQSLKSLRCLNASNNRIHEIDHSIVRLTKLYEINLNKNKIEDADIFHSLASLKICYLYHNKVHKSNYASNSYLYAMGRGNTAASSGSLVVPKKSTDLVFEKDLKRSCVYASAGDNCY